MRTLSENAINKLRTRLGNEPVVIIEVQWAKDGSWLAYADREIENIVRGKILEVGNLDAVVAVSENNDSQEISVTFDDTDGSIKDILDHNDIHKRDVRVWQWFEGLSLDDKFLLFRGKINSPIIWNEGEQTVSFSVVSQIEDKEFGFSPEEGQFPYIPVELIGKAWPSCFGTPIDVPCVAIGKAARGTTLAGLGIISGEGYKGSTGITADDVQTSRGLTTQNIQKGHVGYVASAWLGIDSAEYQRYNDQRNQLSESIAQTWASRFAAKRQQEEEAQRRLAEAHTKWLGKNPVRILGGQLFPREVVTLNIDGGLFTGRFGNNAGVDDDLFTISKRWHPENEAAYNAEVEEASKSEVSQGQGGGSFSFISKVPCGKGAFFDPCHYKTEGWIIGVDVIVVKAETVLPKFFWADAGSNVSLHGDEPITYIVSIVPGTVLSVKAFKTFNGVRHLVSVPANYYTVEEKNYGPVHAVQVVLNKTLSTIPDQGWSDDIYVTFQSDVGPDIVEILEYIIDQYTDFSIDHTSFDLVRTKLEQFPANFAILDRKNVINVLQEIAYQARCSLRLINGIFYLTYLPEEPTSIDTITEGDIETNSITVSGTSTEDLVTKLVAEWRISYAKQENKIILRHNIGYYGTHEETYQFYIYNQPDIVLKVATFWLIRKSNTWKIFNFKTFLHKLNIESFDCVTLDFQKTYAANNPVKAIVTSSDFNSDDQTISMECWLPIKFGEMTPYDFAWPADTPPQWIFPTDYEVFWGHSGGGGIGVDAEGDLPLEKPEDNLDEETFISGGGGSSSRRTLDIFGAYSATPRPNHDTGDPHPSDTGFVPQPIFDPEYIGELDTTTPPATTMGPVENEPSVPPMEIPLISDGFAIDLSTTKVRDSGQAGVNTVSYLKDLIHFNAGEDKLCLRSDVHIWDASEPEAEFYFKYDSDSNKWGAGIAWLKD